MRRVSKEELQKIPYVDNIPSDGRLVYLAPYFDEDKQGFIMHVPTRNNKLTWIMAEPCKSYYYSKSKFNETNDIYLDLINVLIQSYSYDTIYHNIDGLLEDIFNCSAFFEKYFILHTHYLETKDLSTSDLIATEIECFFGNIRSLYDLLQIIIKSLWEIETRNELKSSFASMAEKSKEELENKYNLTDSLINYYNETAKLFLIFREIRDKIYHQGLSVKLIFCDDYGFAIDKNDQIFSKLSHVWPKEKVKNNGLVSLLALFSYITKQIIDNLDDLSSALVESITLKLPISTTHKIFIRGPYFNHLNSLDEYLDEQWYIPNKD